MTLAKNGSTETAEKNTGGGEEEAGMCWLNCFCRSNMCLLRYQLLLCVHGSEHAEKRMRAKLHHTCRNNARSRHGIANEPSLQGVQYSLFKVPQRSHAQYVDLHPSACLRKIELAMVN